MAQFYEPVGWLELGAVVLICEQLAVGLMVRRFAKFSRAASYLDTIASTPSNNKPAVSIASAVKQTRK
jgi:hypothetical protein